MISLVLNLDTRPGTGSDQMGDGARGEELMVASAINKKMFLWGFEHELIVYVDEHESLTKQVLDILRVVADKVVIAKHPQGVKHDQFYLEALSLARGEYVIHFDQDCAGFLAPGTLQEWIGLLDQYKFISYPAAHSPRPCHDESFEQSHWWASTRFFLCRRESLDITEIGKCLADPHYMWGKYGEKSRKEAWMEHILGIMHNSSVFYPPLDASKSLIFCWNNYNPGVLSKLNEMPYEKIRDWVNQQGGIQYPNNVDICANP